MVNNTHYVSIDLENKMAFDKACNELAGEGWFPIFGVSTYVTNEGIVHYYQQWNRGY